MHGFFGQELMILRMDWFNLVQLQPQSKHLTGWWYTYPFEKYESIGMMKFPTEWENQNHGPNHQPDLKVRIHLTYSPKIEDTTKIEGAS